VAKEKDTRTRFPLMLIVGLWQGRRQIGAYVVGTKGRPREVVTVEAVSAEPPTWHP
jgi:hypothetical protein